MPTHSPSRADYLNSPNAQTQAQHKCFHHHHNKHVSAMALLQGATGGGAGAGMQESYSNLPLEPAAYNSGGGGFAAF